MDLARLRAGLSAGLTPEQSARLIGTTEEELAADAQTLATQFGAVEQAPLPAPVHRSGGPRGSDAGVPGGTVAAGVEAYHRKHPKRETRPVPTEAQQRANPFAETGYTMEGR